MHNQLSMTGVQLLLIAAILFVRCWDTYVAFVATDCIYDLIVKGTSHYSKTANYRRSAIKTIIALFVYGTFV